MSITKTIGDGYFVSHSRRGERMRKRCKTIEEAKACLNSFINDVVVENTRTRWYFLPDKTLILRKPRLTDPKYKCRYLC
jgi:hypothetical protein